MVVSFHNPSVRDYLMNYLARNREIIISLINSAVFFDQLTRIWKHSQPTDIGGSFEDVIINNIEDFTAALNDTVNFTSTGKHTFETTRSYYTYYGDISLESKIQFVSMVAKKTNYTALNTLLERLLEDEIACLKEGKGSRWQLTGMLEAVESVGNISQSTIDDLKAAGKTRLIGHISSLEDYENLLDYSDLYPNIINEDELSKIKDSLEEIEPSDTHDPDAIREEAQRLDNLGYRLEIDVEHKLAQFEEVASDLESQVPEDIDSSERSSENDHELVVSDSEIISVFSTLIKP